MPRRRLEATPEIAAELARRRAHAEGYEDGIYKRTPKAWAEEASPNALAYLIGYRRGLQARSEIVVKIKKGEIFNPDDDLPEREDH